MIKTKRELDSSRSGGFVAQSFINISLVFWAVIVILPMVWLLYSLSKPTRKSFLILGHYRKTYNGEILNALGSRYISDNISSIVCGWSSPV